MKKCTKCKIEKTEEEFYKYSKNKDGLDTQCKECVDKRNKDWVIKNREKSNDVKKAYKERNREVCLAKQREYANKRYKENKERERARSANWKKNNPEKVKESNSKAYKKTIEKYGEIHREKARVRAKEWRLNNLEKVKEQSRDHKNRSENKIKVKARYIIAKGIRNKTIKKPLKCEKCMSISKLNAHHENYNEPLNIIWLCSKCHGEIHCKY